MPMRTVGIIRTVNSNGRMVIPSEYREILGIRDGESVEIFMEDWSGEQVVVIRKAVPLSGYSEAKKHLKALEGNATTVHPSRRGAYLTALGHVREALDF